MNKRYDYDDDLLLSASYQIGHTEIQRNFKEITSILYIFGKNAPPGEIHMVYRSFHLRSPDVFGFLSQVSQIFFIFI